MRLLTEQLSRQELGRHILSGFSIGHSLSRLIGEYMEGKNILKQLQVAFKVKANGGLVNEGAGTRSCGGLFGSKSFLPKSLPADLSDS